MYNFHYSVRRGTRFKIIVQNLMCNHPQIKFGISLGLAYEDLYDILFLHYYLCESRLLVGLLWIVW